MKKILILLLAVAILATAGIALAGISGSPHDIATYLSKPAGTEPCAYCHTPHQGNINKYPLWNRSQGTQTYTAYTSNTFDMGAAVVSPLDEGSAPCMVCHNGVASGLVNYPGRGSVDQAKYNLVGTDFINAWANLGLDMQNEHPVSFTYDPAADDATQNNGFPPITVLGSVNYVTGANTCFPLYKGQGAGLELSCATCHTVHHTPKDAYTIGAVGGTVYEVYFLRTTNLGSKMCAECHVNRW